MSHKKSIRITNPAFGPGWTSQRNARKWVKDGRANWEKDGTCISFNENHLSHMAVKAGVVPHPKADGVHKPFGLPVAKYVSFLEAGRRARKASALGSHTKEDWVELIDKFGRKCLRCGVSHNDDPLTKDHVVSLAEGGTDFISNIQPLCRKCNTWKGNREIDFRQSAQIAV